MVLIHEYQVGGNDVRQYRTKKRRRPSISPASCPCKYWSFEIESEFDAVAGTRGLQSEKKMKGKHSCFSPSGEVLQILAGWHWDLQGHQGDADRDGAAVGVRHQDLRCGKGATFDPAILNQKASALAFKLWFIWPLMSSVTPCAHKHFGSTFDRSFEKLARTLLSAIILCLRHLRLRFKKVVGLIPN